MKEVKLEMMVTGGWKTFTFQMTFECNGYAFCECKEAPERRGFFTRQYLLDHTK